MEDQQNHQTINYLHLRYLSAIQSNPQPILNIHYTPPKISNLPIHNIHKLYITRPHTIEVYGYDDNQNIFTQQLLRLQLNLRNALTTIQLDSWIIVVGHFEIQAVNLKECCEGGRNWDWEVHPFTTEVIHTELSNKKILYSFHESECMMWWIDTDNDKVCYKYLSQKDRPYHITSKGFVQGYGLKLKHNNKGSIFTCCKLLDKVLLLGDSEGSLHLYDSKYLTHILSIKKHIAPILSIAINQLNCTAYWSGSDSKICSITQVNNEWVVSSQVRGQSHDIISLEIIGSNKLVSSGFNTDLCFYQIDKNSGRITDNISHQVTYSSEDITSLVTNSTHNLLIVNKYVSFQIWSINQQNVTLQCLYHLPQHSNKLINSVKVSKQIHYPINHNLIIMLTSQQTVCFKYNLQNGLEKHFTISHSYQFIDYFQGPYFIALRDTLQQEIQKINCINGQLSTICLSTLSLPTQMKVYKLHNHQQKQKWGAILFIGSKITNQIQLFNLRTKKIIAKIDCSQNYFDYQSNWNQSNVPPYTFFSIDSRVKNLEINNLKFAIKFFSYSQLIISKIPFIDNKKKQLTANEQEQPNKYERFSFSIGLRKIRYGGWMMVSLKRLERTVLKKYFYGVSEGKVIFISNLTQINAKKKIRTKQIQRIGGVAGTIPINPNSQSETLILVGMNLKEHISQGKGAIINRKIYK